MLVSASLEHYVLPAGELLGVDGVLATRLAVDAAGMVSGRFDGKNCRGAEKYARVVGWLRANGLAATGQSQAILWAYGNSRGDALAPRLRPTTRWTPAAWAGWGRCGGSPPSRR